MVSFEHEAFKEGRRFIAGVDEAGRGPLAGPVVAAAVVFPAPLTPGIVGLGIRDSKKLSPKRRELLLTEIHANALAVAVSVISPEEIDEINILQASLKAMKEAVLSLQPPKDRPQHKDASDQFPDMILVDGPFELDLPISQHAIKRGDSLSISIAAASIVAKTTRDRIMGSYHSRFPAYGFLSNKGYGTREHLKALKLHGPTPIHRRSFKHV